ncbi:MAG: SDR family oxidoreductase [Myxococcota bacterium]
MASEDSPTKDSLPEEPLAAEAEGLDLPREPSAAETEGLDLPREPSAPEAEGLDLKKHSLLRDKVVLITGAAGGIGRAIAQRFSEEGAQLMLVDRGTDRLGANSDPTRVDALATELGAAGMALDLAEAGQPSAAVAETVRRFGRLDAVVSSAGYLLERSLLRSETEELRAFFRLHVEAPFELAQATARHLVERKAGGSLVLLASPSAYFGTARRSGEAAAAAAVFGLARSTAVELRRHGIRVNALAVTARTRLTEEQPTFQRIRRGSMEAEHVAPVALFLASDLATDVHGEVIGVAGGRLYGFNTRETTGAFTSGEPMEPEEIRTRWTEIVRG